MAIGEAATRRPARQADAPVQALVLNKPNTPGGIQEARQAFPYIRGGPWYYRGACDLLHARLARLPVSLCNGLSVQSRNLDRHEHFGTASPLATSNADFMSSVYSVALQVPFAITPAFHLRVCADSSGCQLVAASLPLDHGDRPLAPSAACACGSRRTPFSRALELPVLSLNGTQ